MIDEEEQEAGKGISKFGTLCYLYLLNDQQVYSG